MFRTGLATLLLMTQIVFASAAEPAEGVDAPLDQYRVLEWTDLVPEGWEPPLVEEAYDDIDSASVDENAVVSDLDQQLAAIPGYMKPVVFTENRVSEFVLVPHLPHQITAHAHLDPNQMVYVYALEPVVVENPFEPVWVVGSMSTEAVMTDEGPAAYRIVDAVTTEYKY